VLEGVDRIRGLAAREKDLGIHKPNEALAQRRLLDRRRGGQQK
jgi:hypothetical protein